MGEHAFGRTGAARYGDIDFLGVYLIANAVNHMISLLQLRMIVNNFASHSQKHVRLAKKRPHILIMEAALGVKYCYEGL